MIINICTFTFDQSHIYINTFFFSKKNILLIYTDNTVYCLTAFKGQF